MNVQEEIASVAYDLYLMGGLTEGHDLENWLRAEQMVLNWHEVEEDPKKEMEMPLEETHVVEPTRDTVMS